MSTLRFMAAAVLLLCLAACGSAEEEKAPDTGLITTVREVADGQFRIEDEQVASSKDASAIIAKYADNTVDTIPLAEAQRMMSDTSKSNTHYRRNPVVSMATYGLMGYMLGRSSSSFTPSPGAYVDPRTHQRVTSTTGTQFRNATTRTATKSPSGGKSGYGGSSGGSSRSYGG